MGTIQLINSTTLVHLKEHKMSTCPTMLCGLTGRRRRTHMEIFRIVFVLKTIRVVCKFQKI